MDELISIVTRKQAEEWGNDILGRPLVEGEWFCGGRVVITDMISMNYDMREDSQRMID